MGMFLLGFFTGAYVFCVVVVLFLLLAARFFDAVDNALESFFNWFDHVSDETEVLL